MYISENGSRQIGIAFWYGWLNRLKVANDEGKGVSAVLSFVGFVAVQRYEDIGKNDDEDNLPLSNLFP